MVSAGSDGEGVEVVGEDRPGVPGPLAGVTFEAAAVHSVAALEVADAAFGTDSELRQPSVGALRAGGPPAGDEHAVRAGEVLIDGAGREATVEREGLRAQAERVELVGGGGQHVILVGRPDLRRGGEDQAARAAAGVL